MFPNRHIKTIYKRTSPFVGEVRQAEILPTIADKIKGP